MLIICIYIYIYIVLDASDDAIFLHVNHFGEKSLFGNIYVSNSHGLNYTLSLPHNVRKEGGECAFVRIDGVEGIYIANYQDNVDFDKAYSKSIHNPQKPKSSTDNKQLTVKKQFAKSRSVITYDKGGKWSYIEPPKKDSKGKTVKCDTKKGCGLNLVHASAATETSGLYSVDSAVGLIMATGNIGSYLEPKTADLNTYFSRDAGLTWKEVAKGAFIYEFGDHGGLIVMAAVGKKTHSIWYSHNEGHSWKKFRFSETPMAVENIITEPSALSQKFIIYGVTEELNGGFLGRLIHVDFGELHINPCQGHDTPDSETSDYEVWTLKSNAADTERCVLGKQISYTRRKQFSQCFNGEEFERPISVKNCECTDADWECDFNNARNVGDKLGECHEIFPINQTKFMEEQCTVGDVYYVVNGYRKVAGDTCSGGVSHEPQEFRCVHWTKQISGNGWVVVVMFIIATVALGTLTFIHKQKKGSRAFSSFNGSTTSYWNSFTSWIRESGPFPDILPGQWRYGYFTPGSKIPDNAFENIKEEDAEGDDLDDFTEVEEPALLTNRRKKGKGAFTMEEEDFNPRQDELSF